VIAGGYDDAVTAFTCVAARKFASPPYRQLEALSSLRLHRQLPSDGEDQAIG